MKRLIILSLLFIILLSETYSQVVIADAVKLVHSTNPSVPEIIVDNSELDNFFPSGYWPIGTA